MTKAASGSPTTRIPEAASKLGGRLQVIEQGNLGGSGGFARSMDETVSAGKSDYVLLIDDDVQFDPEGLLRAVTFADLARRPTIVGGHMFSRYDRCVMHAYAEAVAPYPWWWGAAPNTKARHDFGRRNLRNTPWLHRRADSDYNGWWMCLIPTRVIRELGLALPVFIKWDDAEYGLRARSRGYPTVTLPGVAAWQAPWDDKNDALDWQAYYHTRNRLVSALLHSPHPRGGSLVWESMERQLQSLLSMQYSTAALRLLAVQDVLTGPGTCTATSWPRWAAPRGTGAVRRRRVRRRHRQLPARTAPRAGGREGLHHPDRQGQPDGQGPDRVRAAAAAAPPGSHEAAADGPPPAGRFLVRAGQLDSAVVSTADGTGAAWYRRDRRLFRSLGRRSLVLHYRLRRQWPRLAAQYRAAAPDFTSPGTWRDTSRRPWATGVTASSPAGLTASPLRARPKATADHEPGVRPAGGAPPAASPRRPARTRRRGRVAHRRRGHHGRNSPGADGSGAPQTAHPPRRCAARAWPGAVWLPAAVRRRDDRAVGVGAGRRQGPWATTRWPRATRPCSASASWPTC